MKPILSVIICTYNRGFILSECLRSLTEQTAPAGAYEVIVVDNNSKDDTKSVVARFIGQVPGLRFIEEEMQGAGYARNAGIVAAAADWIACLDSDGKAHRNWVETILVEIDKGNFDCFGGPYLAWHCYGPPPSWFAPEWESTTTLQTFYGALPENQYPTSGSCAFSKALIKSVGGFPTEIGMSGNKCAYGEETLLFRRMRETGATLGFVPEMLIDHCVLPYKYTVKWRLGAAYAHGRDAPLVFDFPRTLRTLVREGWRLVKALCHSPVLLVRGISQGHAWQRLVLDSLSPIISSCGSCVKMIRLLTAKEG